MTRPIFPVRRWSSLASTSAGIVVSLTIAFGFNLVFLAGSAAAAPTPATTPGPAAASGGSVGIRIVDIPVAEKDDPRARIYIIDRLAPGTTIKRRIEISNTTAATADVALYPAAANIVAGQFSGATGHTQNTMSSWVSVTPAGLAVAAGKPTMATVTIAIPANAAPGELYGVIWAEVRSQGSTGTGTAGSAVQQVNRVGIRIYLSVGPGNAPASNFSIGSVTAERSSSGDPVVVTSVQNTGGRALDMNGSLELTNGPGGLSAGPFPVTLGTTLAVGATGPVITALSKELPAGPWVATITLRSGILSTVAKGTITFPVSGSAAAVSTDTGSGGIQTWIYVAVGILVLLAGAGAGVLQRQRLRRRRPDTRRHRRAGPKAPPEADAIKS